MNNIDNETNSRRSLYSADISTFLNTDKTTINESIKNIFADIVGNYHGDTNTETRNSWETEIKFLQKALQDIDDTDGKIFFEYNIPRLGKRIDVVLLLQGIVFCLEFKVGEKDKKQCDMDQVLDYALSLKNFHQFCANRIIVPILIPTKYNSEENQTTISECKDSSYSNGVLNPLVISTQKGTKKDIIECMKEAIQAILKTYPNELPIESNWELGNFLPTPTIIDIARKLYKEHTVEDIKTHEADQVATDVTVNTILNIIQKSKENFEKSICFVTGVPGAGKTLVGLDVAIKIHPKQKNKHEKGVYLSGNGPLVAVLTEALARDARDRYITDKKKEENQEEFELEENDNGEKEGTIKYYRTEVEGFIQIIHRYRDAMLVKIKNPIENNELKIDDKYTVEIKEGEGYGEYENVAIFDEAQRSWTKEHLANYLKRGGTYGNKMKVDNFPLSEAGFLIWSLDQHKDWATIVCLVGGGQEINTGEAGIVEWIDALNKDFSHWKIYISSHLTEKEYAEGNIQDKLKNRQNVTYNENLHLSVSMRSFRAEKLSAFVHALLNLEKENAQKLYAEIKDKYPIYITRDMETAKKWLHSKVRGTERTGVLISKESARYKPLGIHVLPSDNASVIHWFLDDKKDTRSSNYLEDAATEFQVQGLELDYTCLLWDADFRYNEEKDQWDYYKFRTYPNTVWKEIGKEKATDEEQKKYNEQRKYMLNAYRVLLTRARQGMIICVPSGNSNKNYNDFYEDETRLPEYYNGTYNYLKSLGLEEM